MEAHRADAFGELFKAIHKARAAIDLFGMVAINESGVHVQYSERLRASGCNGEEQQCSIWNVQIVIGHSFAPKVRLHDHAGR